jgi:hypothetical protein
MNKFLILFRLCRSEASKTEKLSVSERRTEYEPF